MNPSQRLINQSQKISVIEQIFIDNKSDFKTIIKLLRIHQYVKNTLVFLPLILGHLYFNSSAVINCVLAFVIFCLLSSSIYLINDLFDLEFDRQHQIKCNRPFASGNISLSFGLIIAPLLLLTACLLALYLPETFFLSVITYYVFCLLYTFYFKDKLLLDVFLLSVLYTIRIVAGISALQIDYSLWMITFSIFLFLSLAFVKRSCELELINRMNKTAIPGRNYLVSDLPLVQAFGIASGYISVLVLALYINSTKIMTLYQYPLLLWFICLFVLYWVSRIWVLATRGLLKDDPVIFAIKDKTSWLVLILSGIIILLAAR